MNNYPLGSSSKEVMYFTCAENHERASMCLLILGETRHVWKRLILNTWKGTYLRMQRREGLAMKAGWFGRPRSQLRTQTLKTWDSLTSRCSTIILWSARKTCWSRTEDKCHAWVPSKHRREAQTSALKYSIIKLSILQFFKIIHFIILEGHYKLEMENVLSFSLHWI